MPGRRKTYKTRTCPHCDTDIKARGYASHEKSCNSKRVKRQQDAAFHASQHPAVGSIPPGGNGSGFFIFKADVVYNL
jgi:hypothetical protein